MNTKARTSFPRRVAALFGAAALTVGLVACGSEDSLEPTSETAFRAQDCPRVEPTDADSVSVEGAVGWGDARRDIQETENRCATPEDMQAFFESFEEPEGGGSGPAPTRSPSDGDSGGGSIPGFSVAAVDAAADGSLETKPIERNDPYFNLPVAVPTPGIAVEFQAGADRMACTLALVGEKRGDLVGVTAGHCNRDATNPEAAWYPDGGSVSESLGTLASDYCYSRESCGDYGLIDLGDASASGGKIAGKYEISGVMDPADLEANMELCKYGVSTGESCGTLMGVEGNRGRAGIDNRSGDSGAPVYVKKADGSAVLVGIHGGAPHGSDGRAVDDVSDFTLAAAAIEGLGIDRVL